MKRFYQILNRKTQPLYLLFVNLRAAFDSIQGKWLFIMIKLCFLEGENVKLFNILEKFYQKTYQEALVTFLVTSDVRQVGLKVHACSICTLTLLCLFSRIIVQKMTLFDFLNINIESMRDQYPGNNDSECVMKVLSSGDLLLYFGGAMWTV